MGQVVRIRLTTAGALLLLLSASALLVLASLERWAVAAPVWTRRDLSVEDGRLDYLMPGAEWLPVGVAAQLAGAGMLLIALALVLMTRALAMTSAGAGAVPLVGWATAIPFALAGAHALLSGALGSASPLGVGSTPLLLFVSTPGILALALMGSGVSRVWSGAVLLLLGSTPLGVIAGSFLIAPLLAGRTSFDTTPWTETVSAAAPASAALLLAVWALRVSAGASGARHGASAGTATAERP